MEEGGAPPVEKSRDRERDRGERKRNRRSRSRERKRSRSRDRGERKRSRRSRSRERKGRSRSRERKERAAAEEGGAPMPMEHPYPQGPFPEGEFPGEPQPLIKQEKFLPSSEQDGQKMSEGEEGEYDNYPSNGNGEGNDREYSSKTNEYGTFVEDM